MSLLIALAAAPFVAWQAISLAVVVRLVQFAGNAPTPDDITLGFAFALGVGIGAPVAYAIWLGGTLVTGFAALFLRPR
ncbi:hypothetical protein [Albimonas pacifica]|uniref:hypothetical protein n=1 Tax=Albimonas pacifica TaxID=1114924 RepID=UPI000B8486F5|nr:hypothetical protein [Albimonas pacifica]